MTTSISPASDPPPARSLVVRKGDFLAWLEHARPGDRLTYHQGHLGADREEGSALSDGLRQELGRIADHAMELAVQGHVLLVQKRLDDGCAAYLAIRTAQPQALKETTP